MNLELRDIKVRIERIRDDKNLNQAEFAASIGLSQSGYATLLRREGSSHRLKTLTLAIEAVYGIRHEWLLTGDDPKLRGTEKHLDPLQQIQNKILSSEGIAAELKAESFRLMVSNEAQGVLLGMMMRSLAISRNIEERGAPSELLKEMESNRLKANEIFKKFEDEFEEACKKLSPNEQILLACEIFSALKNLKLSSVADLRDEVSKLKVESELGELIGKIDQIRQLTKSTKKIKEWEKKPLIDIDPIESDPSPGWTRKVFSGGDDEA